MMGQGQMDLLYRQPFYLPAGFPRTGLKWLPRSREALAVAPTQQTAPLLQ